MLSNIDKNEKRISIRIGEVTQIIGSNTKLFTFFFRFKFIGVSETTAIDKLTTLFPPRVVIPSREVALAGPRDFWQVT